MADSMDLEEGERAFVATQNSSMYPSYLAGEVDGKPFIFLLPRKCASNTIKNYIRQLNGHNLRYLRPHEMNNFPMVPKIAVVRHPVDRVISAWKHGTQGDDLRYMNMVGAKPWMSWDDFVDRVCSEWTDANCNPHFRSYSLELMSHEFGYSDLLRVETLKSDWLHLSNKYGWRDVVIKHLNKTKKLPVTVSRLQLEWLSVRYEMDATNFNYDILSWENPK